MANRLHVCKKYEVEYASYTNFNWKSVQFHDFCCVMGIEIYGNTEDADYPSSFEIKTEDWDRGIKKLQNIDALQDNERTEIEGALSDLNVSKEEMIIAMQRYQSEADQNHPYLEFCFF